MRDVYSRRLTGRHTPPTSPRSLNDGNGSPHSYDGSSRSLGVGGSPPHPPRSFRVCDSLSRRPVPLGSPSRSFRICDSLPKRTTPRQASMPLASSQASSHSLPRRAMRRQASMPLGSPSAFFGKTRSNENASHSPPITPRPSPTSTSLVIQEEDGEATPAPSLPTVPSRSTEERVDDEPSSSQPTCADTNNHIDDCPICLNEMSPADISHQLQCPNTCGYNFCRPCIESLINSSKDDFKESSDGNMHVKIYLKCPSCRSDLSSTIRDTVLLRKADHIKSCSGVCDEKLTPSERRMKYAMKRSSVTEAIADARVREAEFFGKKNDEAEIQAIIETSAALIARVISDDSEDYDDCGSNKTNETTETDATQEAKVTPRRKSGRVGRRRRTSVSRSSIYQLIDEAKKVREKKKMSGMKETEVAPKSTRSNVRGNTGRNSSNEQTSRRYGRGRMTWW